MNEKVMNTTQWMKIQWILHNEWKQGILHNECKRNEYYTMNENVMNTTQWMKTWCTLHNAYYWMKNSVTNSKNKTVAIHVKASSENQY